MCFLSRSRIEGKMDLSIVKTYNATGIGWLVGNNKRYITIILGIIFAVFLGITTQTNQGNPQNVERSDGSWEESSEIASGQSSFIVCFLDVGQADAALVECDGHYMLIDGGNAADSSKLYTLLKEKDIQYLDMVVASHAHEDHVGGLAGALNFASAGIVLCPTVEYETDEFLSFKKYAEQNGGGIIVPNVGDSYALGSAVVNVLGVNAVEEDNDSSIILRITYGETAFIFTGDAERMAEQAVLDSGAILQADVLKVGHHGSDTSTIYPFLREIMPEYAVISVGAENNYGHPTEAVLSRLEDADVTVYRTDLQGDIWCYSNGTNVTFQTEQVEMSESTNTNIGSIQESESGSGSMTSDTITYILNVKSKKFHYPTCESVGKMADKNKDEYTGSRADVIEMGYEPCGNCKP